MKCSKIPFLSQKQLITHLNNLRSPSRHYVRGIIYFYKTHLEKHFQEEEDVLFRITDDPLCLRAMEEHKRIRDLVKAISGDGAQAVEYYRGCDCLNQIY